MPVLSAQCCSVLPVNPSCAAYLACMNTNTSIEGLAPLVGIEELAEYLDVPIKTLYKWRQEGSGPPSVRVGRHVRYFVSDVNDWLLDQRSAVHAHTGVIGDDR